MIRRVLVIVAATLCLNPIAARAQSAVITVKVASADVYKGPSTGSAIIGKAPRGTVLTVTRELGSWVKVSWSKAPDGIGYVHVSMGTVTPAAAAVGHAAGAPPRASGPAATAIAPRAAQQPRREQPLQHPVVYVSPASHVLAVGGIVNTTSGFGATGRGWRRDRLGAQLDLTRESIASAIAPERLTSFHVEPGVLFGLHDRVGDYVWLRPYVGASIGLVHRTLAASPVEPGASAIANDFGWRALAGTELTFADMPRFALSVDVSYRRFDVPFAGFDAHRVGVAMAGRWYVR